MKLTTTSYAAGGVLIAAAVVATIANFFLAGAAHTSTRKAQKDAIAR